MNGIIYKYTNLINNKVYIGQTDRPAQRKAEHIYSSKNRYKNSAFHSAIKKYGIENFSYEVIENIVSDSNEYLINKLNEREKFWIKEYKSQDREFGYNITEGGDKRGKRCKKIYMYDKQGNIIKIFNSYHDVVNEYHCYSSTVYHALKTEDSLFLNKYVLKFENVDFAFNSGKKSKHIYLQYDLNDNLLKKWNSVCDIEKELGFCPSMIIKCCLYPQKHKVHKGYKWKRILK